MFQPLNKEEIEQIVRLQINAVAKRLAAQEVATLHVNDDAIELIARAGFDPELAHVLSNAPSSACCSTI